MPWPTLLRTSASALFIVLELGRPSTEAVEWKPFAAHRIATVTPSQARADGFTLTDGKETGLLFTNFLSQADQEANHNLLNGAGVALGDVDGDGFCDVFLANIGGRTSLFKNLGGWRFKDISADAGVALERQFAHGAAFADLDGDDDLDLVLTFTDVGTKLFLNDGKGKFTLSVPPGFAGETGASSVALGDMDGDGDLDLYVANYGAKTIRSGGRVPVTMQQGREVVVGRMRNRLKILNGTIIEYGEPDRYYVNDGNGSFRQLPFTSGAFLNETGEALKEELWDMGLSVAIRDMNQDGLPDIYVCNDFQNPDRIWINKGAGKFQAIARHAIRISSHFSMGVDFGDLDRDGFDDFMVVDMLSREHKLRMTQMSPASPTAAETLEAALDRPQVRRNMLYWNRGDGTYAETAFYSDLAASDWAWCPVFIDVDLDGYEDILVTNGHAYDTQDLDATARNAEIRAKIGQRTGHVLSTFPPLATPNYAFKNLRGLRFQETGASWGFDSKQVSHGMALADLDNDGDLDAVVNCLNAPALVYRNEALKPRLLVRLKGERPNTRGIGARIEVTAPAFPTQAQEMQVGTRFLSSDDPARMFAVGSLTDTVQVKVRWRSGKETVVTNVPANAMVEVSEAPATEVQAAAKSPKSAPLFSDGDLKWSHRPLIQNDWETQPLLIHSWSSGMPAAAAVDLNADNFMDIVLSGGLGGGVQVATNLAGKGFSPPARLPFASTSTNARALKLSEGEINQVAIVSPAGGILAVSQMPDVASRKASGVHQVNLKDGTTKPLILTNVLWGALASADVNMDGSPDLLACARLLPGKYPARVDSCLFLGSPNGDLNSAQPTFLDLGNVTAAQFVFINTDKAPDLVVATDGGPLRAFINEHGTLVERTEELGLAPHTGWWTSLAVGDFNGDGASDFLAGNFGLNTQWQPPFSIYYGDFEGKGILDIFPATPDLKLQTDLPHYDLGILRKASPTIAERFATHADYASADLGRILGEQIKTAGKQTITTLATTLFLQRNGAFQPHPLPLNAQLSPTMGVTAADFNRDGELDIFLAQNFFGVRPEAFRFDSSRGLVLLGDGAGAFEPMTAAASGVEMYGEQRSPVAADFNNDMAPDLLVLEYSGPARLLLNDSQHR